MQGSKSESESNTEPMRLIPSLLDAALLAGNIVIPSIPQYLMLQLCAAAVVIHGDHSTARLVITPYSYGPETL